MAKYDFAGWATKANLKCSDGRVIMPDAFKECDGQTVPIVWNHQHNDVENVLGHALLKNEADGVRAYGSFNDTEAGKAAKSLVEHGDITALSIFADKLKQTGSNVKHGVIREVSLVLAPANPGAFIDTVSFSHGDGSDDEGIIYTGLPLVLYHSEDSSEESKTETSEETVADIIDSMNEKQQTVMYTLIGEILEGMTGKSDDLEDDNKEKEGEEKTMKHNVFEGSTKETENTLSHDEISTIINDAKRYGSLKESFLAHASDYGIDNIEYLFPEAKTLNNQPDFISREMDWVRKVMSAVHRSPFSRVKSMHANITEDEARAKGYIKGKMKKEEVFSLLKRTTTPTTVYKKQKLDRDDVVDITDFDVVSWLKTEMRIMLDEELARAMLVGDGRLSSSDDKINETNIRPIWKDADLYTIKVSIDYSNATTDNEKAKTLIRQAIKARKQYKGSGNPTLYTTEDMVTDLLLLEDNNGRVIYDSIDKLATALRVKEIVAVPVMENLTRTTDDSKKMELLGIIVNLTDYNVGADKGGAINMFDDFDIDYNQQKYLIETRCSGALTKPYSAIALETEKNG